VFIGIKPSNAFKMRYSKNYCISFSSINILVFRTRFLLLFYVCAVFSTNFFAQTIGAGGYHSISVCQDQTVMSWGDNSYGQLGNGTTTESHIPVSVSGLSGIIATGALSYASIFLKNDGTVWGCGENDDGELGDGTTTHRSTIVQVGGAGFTGITAIAGGSYHSLFLKNDGTVWSSGYNYYGELGDGTWNDAHTPVQASSLSNIIAIAAGYYHSAYLKSDGTVMSSGRNVYGELGNGSTASWVLTPVAVVGLTGITAIAGGGRHQVFLKNDGTVWACGLNNYGQLGDGTTTNTSTPVQVSGLTNVVAISAGYYNSFFLKSDGTAWGCGYNAGGQIGDGTTTNRLVPVQITTGVHVVSGGRGPNHSVFMKNDRTVWATGLNGSGQLGDNTITAETTPIQSGFNIICTTLLPIELLNFKAKPANRSVSLEWSTASETNNDHFTIERSEGGINFEEVTSIKGAGTSTRTINYQTTDAEPLYGISYYRLKQTDYDGKFTYSNLAPVSFATMPGESELNIYPNPSSSGQQMQLCLTAPENKQILVVVYDIMGKEYFSKVVITQRSGENILALDVSEKLASGVYYVSAATDNKVFRKKLVIQ
jgi:alpha-tubulin suppressor-like RCC1 family protein